MKLAVLLAGHFRNYEGTYKIFKENVYDKYDCDVFMHTWDKQFGYREPINDIDKNRDNYLTYSTQELRERFNIKDIIIDRYDEEFREMFYKETLKYYHRKSIFKYDSDPFVDLQRSNTHEYIVRSWSFFYKRLQCFEMMKMYSLHNNIKYDLVVCCRPDYVVYGNFEKLPKDKLTCPHLKSDDPNHLHIFDTWCIGPVDLIQEWSSIYSRLRLMDREFKYGHKLCMTDTNTNQLVQEFVKYMNIPINMVPLNDPPFVTELNNL